MTFVILLTLFLIIKSSTADDGDWSYENPDDWKTNYPDCGGENQSPIDIVQNDTIQYGSLDLIWKNYDKLPKSIKAVNNGETVQLDIEWNDGDEIPSITSSLFDGEYVFARYHFHWGPNDESGSEHTFNGESTPLEGHMTHYKKDYSSLDEAMGKKDGLVVIATVGTLPYEEDPEDKHFKNEDRKKVVLQSITPHIDDIIEIGGTAVIDPFPLTDFQVVNSKPDYVSYNGSILFPKCSEIVTWIISLDPIEIPKDQLEMLRKVKLANGVDHNYRPTQPINGREVYLFSSLNDPPEKEDLKQRDPEEEYLEAQNQEEEEKEESPKEE